MSGKELLLRDVELAKWWVSICHDPRFELVLNYVESEFARIAPGWEQLKGGQDAFTLLQTITDNPPDAAVFPDSGLDHRRLEEIAKRPAPTTLEPKA